MEATLFLGIRSKKGPPRKPLTLGQLIAGLNGKACTEILVLSTNSMLTARSNNNKK